MIASIERKGVPFREFLQSRDEAGLLPRFQVKLGDETRFVYSEDQFVELKKANEELQREDHAQRLSAIPMEEQTEEMKKFALKSLPCVELYEAESLNYLKGRLLAYDLALTTTS